MGTCQESAQYCYDVDSLCTVEFRYGCENFSILRAVFINKSGEVADGIVAFSIDARIASLRKIRLVVLISALDSNSRYSDVCEFR